jgi:hypothetical protein
MERRTTKGLVVERGFPEEEPISVMGLGGGGDVAIKDFTFQDATVLG